MLKIKELRVEKNISQQKLAESIKTKRYTIANWEQKRAEPSINDLIKIADYFEVSTDYLLGRSNDLGIIEIKNELTPQENQVIRYFKQLTPQYQQRVIGYMESLLAI